MSRPSPAPAEVMDRLAYWHDLRAELPAEAVDAARSYLIGFLAADVDAQQWADAVDQAVALARAEADHDDDDGRHPWPMIGAAILTGAGVLGMVELAARVIGAAAIPGGVA